jgi:hypothetical protein
VNFFLWFVCVHVCVVLEIKYRALYMLDKPSTTELQPQPNDLSECLERIRNCVLSFWTTCSHEITVAMH